jgi:hypothetical protein
LKVLYEVGYLEPALIAEYVGDFIKLLKSRHNRMVWGSMIALSTIAEIKAEEIFKHYEEIKKTMEKGSVITVDNGIKTLAIAAATKNDLKKKIFPYLLKHLETCRPKEVPQHAEKIAVAVDAKNKKKFAEVLEKRMIDMSSSQAVRVKKVIKKVAASFVLVLVSMMLPHNALTQTPGDPLEPLHFLEGTWHGQGQSPYGPYEFEAKSERRGRWLLGMSNIYIPRADSLMLKNTSMIGHEDTTLVAYFFENTGMVRYKGSVVKDGVRFEWKQGEAWRSIRLSFLPDGSIDSKGEFYLPGMSSDTLKFISKYLPGKRNTTLKQ